MGIVASSITSILIEESNKKHKLTKIINDISELSDEDKKNFTTTRK